MKLLNLEADTYTSRLGSRYPILEENIKNSLIFVTDLNLIGQKYFDPEGFNNLQSIALSKIPTEEFQQFANSCKKLYQYYGQENTLKSSSVYLLFEKVTEKYYKDYKLLQKLNSFKKRNQKIESKIGNTRLIDTFINADKHINAH